MPWPPKGQDLNLFDEMGLPKPLIARLLAQNITEPTPIQTHAIPHALDGHDVMGLAQTGTGKTMAFGLPLVTRLMEAPGRPAPKSVRSLILAPTRELAGQIRDALMTLVKDSPIKIGLVVGGASINPQINRLARGTDILVATPGRLLDLIDRRALRRIAGLLPADRQTMLFSATMPKQMEEIAASYLRNPRRVQVSPPGKAADKIAQEVHFVAKAAKADMLIECLDKHRDELALVFGRTKHGSDKLARRLEQAGFAVAAIHGNKSQGQRERALAAFRDGRVRVLVATDVAARGLDIPAVTHVYNYELPNVAENYVHRIGRTARAGRDGTAIAFCAPDEMGELKDIQKALGTTIPVASGRAWEVLPDPKAKPKGRGGPRRGGGGAKPGAGAKPGGQRRRRPRRAA